MQKNKIYCTTLTCLYTEKKILPYTFIDISRRYQLFLNDKTRELQSLRLSKSFWKAHLNKRTSDIYRNIINPQTKFFKRTIRFAHFSKTHTNCIKQLNVPLYSEMTNILTCKIKSSLLFQIWPFINCWQKDIVPM